MSAAERLVALFVTPASAPRVSAGCVRAAAVDGAPSAVNRGQRLGESALHIVPPTERDDVLDAAAHPAATQAEYVTAPVALRERAALPAATAVPDAPSLACGLRVCVLGGSRAGERFAAALAVRLARLPGARCATICTSADADAASPRPTRPVGPPAATARRVAHALAADADKASARGRVVTVLLPDAPGAAHELLAAVHAHAPGAPTLTVLPGVRATIADELVADQDVVLVVVSADAPAGLAELAVAEIGRTAPGAVVLAVPLPLRHGAAARRAAIGFVLEKLR